MCEADIGKQNGHNTLYNAKQSKVDRFFTGGNIFLLFSDSTVLVINPRTYMQIHTPTVVQVGGVDGPPPPPPPLEFLICCSVSKRFYLRWKAFDILYKMRYILWVVALLGACDVTNNGRHLGFYQELEIRLKPREMVISFALGRKNNTK